VKCRQAGRQTIDLPSTVAACPPSFLYFFSLLDCHASNARLRPSRVFVHASAHLKPRSSISALPRVVAHRFWKEGFCLALRTPPQKKINSPNPHTPFSSPQPRLSVRGPIALPSVLPSFLPSRLQRERRLMTSGMFHPVSLPILRDSSEISMPSCFRSRITFSSNGFCPFSSSRSESLFTPE